MAESGPQRHASLNLKHVVCINTMHSPTRSRCGPLGWRARKTPPAWTDTPTAAILGRLVAAANGLLPNDLRDTSDTDTKLRRWTLLLSVLAIALLLVSGWFGGKMVYVHGVAVKTPPEPAPMKAEHRMGT